MSIAGQLNESIEKVARIIDLCAALQEENNLLKMENDLTKKNLRKGEAKIEELEEKLRVMALARSLDRVDLREIELNEKSLDIKQKITEFVREIDKCIVLLKK